MSRKTIYIGLACGLIGTLLVRAALVSVNRGTENAPAVDLAENAPAPQGQLQPVADTVVATAPPAPQPMVKPMPEKVTAKPEENDGKTVLATEDGKTILPADGKETLPGIGEQIGQRTSQQIDPNAYGPPTEFLNRPETSTNPLLNPPNPVNVSGPTVSAEARE